MRGLLPLPVCGVFFLCRSCSDKANMAAVGPLASVVVLLLAAAARADVPAAAINNEAADCPDGTTRDAVDEAAEELADGPDGGRSVTVRMATSDVSGFSTGMGKTPVASSMSDNPRLHTSDSTAYVCPKMRSGCVSQSTSRKLMARNK